MKMSSDLQPPQGNTVIVALNDSRGIHPSVTQAQLVVDNIPDSDRLKKIAYMAA